MVQSRSERNPRTASLPTASRCARYAVRGLVVAGFAAVAWLLSASAANASDGSDGLDQQRFGLLTPVTGLLVGDGHRHDEARDTGHGERDHRGDRGDRGDLVTSTVLTVLSPVDTVTSVVTSSQVADTQASVQTVDRAAHSTTADASSVQHPSTKRPAKAGIKKTHPKRAQEPAVQAVPVRLGPGGDVTAAATGGAVAGVDRTDAAVVSRAADRLDAEDGTIEPPVVSRTDAQGTHHVPLLPRPAPLPASPAAGLASGVPSAGSGLNHDGGAAAVLPAAPAGAKVVTFRPVAVEDDELRLSAAEKPTVSPD
ncbi:hypothetical protein Drose_00160 [Dactylosporangium roseum]|uniref:Uncharacterized protein n=1 Tax=Dactylosporangium roseum TaxID=47989 RepID=A0ABY5Z713_9ACTN|nr:hypothetical protein [Dactylosporangium roseum]UWZ36810.1 hypothetical protein Drose_00160 [Dactylosporangium roseum]